MFSIPCCSHSFCCIFDKKCSVFFTDFLDFFNITRKAIKLSRNNKFNFWIHLKCFFKCYRIHVPGISFSINKYWNSAFINNWIQSCIKSHIAAENSFSFNCSVSDFRLAIKFFTCKFYAEMKSRCTAGQCHCIFNFIDICTYC